MTLCDRLLCMRTARIVGRPRAYRLHGGYVVSVADVIREILERYSRRFGPIERQCATEFHTRLSKRFWGNKFRPCLSALERDLSPWTTVVYPRKTSFDRAIQCMNACDDNKQAEQECIAERRRYVPRKYFDAARETPKKRQRAQQLAALRQDERNLLACRKLINNIKGVLNENS